VCAQAGGTHGLKRLIISFCRSEVEVAQPPHGYEELSVVCNLLGIDVRQAAGELVADVGVEEQADDDEVEVGVRQAGITPVQDGGDLSAGRVVEDVLGLEVGMRQRIRRRVLIARPGLVGAP